MPEEINRIVTDRLADLLLTPSRDADENLRARARRRKIHFVGNVMIDTLHRHLPLATLDRVSDRIPVDGRPYAVLTLHRPSNVDEPETFRSILGAIAVRRVADARRLSGPPAHAQPLERVRPRGWARRRRS